jgi:hypothetical protein
MSKEEEMRTLFDEWRTSGKPRATFARDRGIAINTFHYWCQRFEGKRTTRKRDRARQIPAPAAPTFVEVTEPAAPALPQPLPQPPPRMRFELPDGTAIIVY